MANSRDETFFPSEYIYRVSEWERTFGCLTVGGASRVFLTCPKITLILFGSDVWTWEKLKIIPRRSINAISCLYLIKNAKKSILNRFFMIKNVIYSFFQVDKVSRETRELLRQNFWQKKRGLGDDIPDVFASQSTNIRGHVTSTCLCFFGWAVRSIHMRVY